MIRNILGSLLALLGAAAVVRSPFHHWYGGRPGYRFALADLFSGTGISSEAAGLAEGLFLPMAAAAVLTVLGVLLRSRIVVALAGVLALGFTVLWMVRQGMAAGSLAVGSDGGGLGIGVAIAAGGAAVMLLGAVVMRGRRPRRRRRAHALREEPDQQPYDAGPYGPEARQSPVSYGQGAHDAARPGPYGTTPQSPPVTPHGGPQRPVQWPGAPIGQHRGGTGQGSTGDTRPLPAASPGPADQPGATDETRPTERPGPADGTERRDQP